MVALVTLQVQNILMWLMATILSSQTWNISITQDILLDNTALLQLQSQADSPNLALPLMGWAEQGV